MFRKVFIPGHWCFSPSQRRSYILRVFVRHGTTLMYHVRIPRHQHKPPVQNEGGGGNINIVSGTLASHKLCLLACCLVVCFAAQNILLLHQNAERWEREHARVAAESQKHLDRAVREEARIRIAQVGVEETSSKIITIRPLVFDFPPKQKSLGPGIAGM